MGLFGIATNSVQMLVLVAVLTVAVFAVLYFKFLFVIHTFLLRKEKSYCKW